jgi:hypothetical protein
MTWLSYRISPGGRCRERRRRPRLAGGELTLAVWPDLTFTHRAEPTRADRSELNPAERTWSGRLNAACPPGICVPVGLGSRSVSRSRIMTRNIGLGSARPVPG